MTGFGEYTLIISRNTTALLSSYYHFDQLFSDDPRRPDIAKKMLESAKAIKAAADEIYERAKIIADGEEN